MVIGVLSVLLAIILPTIKTVRAAALRRQAAAEATALAQAAIRYKAEYGFWPGQLQVKNAAQGTVELNDATPSEVKSGEKTLPCIVYGHPDFLNDLKARDQDGNDISHLILKLDEDDTDGRIIYQAFSTVGDSSSAPYPVNPLNPKGIRFLDLQNEGDRLRVDYRDPWDQSYILFMGLNPRGVFTYDIKNSADAVIATHSVSNQIAFAFSLGPREQDRKNLIYSAGVTP